MSVNENKEFYEKRINHKTYEHIQRASFLSNPNFNLKKKDLEEVKEELVSVIIVSRNEDLLNKTIENMYEYSEGPIEFIIVLDGKTETPVKVKKEIDITIAYNEESTGRRPASNQACKLAKGKYLYHIDGHVKTNVKGWDNILKQSCTTPTTMVIPSLYNLDPETYEDDINNRGGMGHKYISARVKDEWGIKPLLPLEPTITGNGMGWFLQKDYYDSFGGCDEDNYPPTWGCFGLEWACKVWLTDYGMGTGQVLLSREVKFAHKWKKTLEYKAPNVAKGRHFLRSYFSNNAPNQVRSFAFFEENLNHLIPRSKKIKKKPMLVNEPEITCILNTNGMYPELIEETIESYIRQDYINKRLLIVSACPSLKISEELRERGDIELILLEEPFERFPQQIQFALKKVKTPLWTIMDSDDVFASNHLKLLSEAYIEAKKEGLQSPCYIYNNKAIEQWQGNRPYMRERGWWCGLYERIDNNIIDDVFNSFLSRKNKDTGSDLNFIKQNFWNKREFDYESTVLHRLGVGFHIRREHQSPGQHYKNSIDQVKALTPEPLEAQWRVNYEKQINDFNFPSVCLIMNTFQRSPEVIQEAIDSFIKQDYPNKKLLICNSNENPFILKTYSHEIEVYNMNSKSHIKEFKAALDQVNTEFVSILDDDDLIEPNHISQLVFFAQKNKLKNVINTNYIEHDLKKNVKRVTNNKKMWWNGLYRTSEIKKIDVGKDLQAFDKRYMEQLKPIEFEGDITYIWRRNHVIHESKTKRNSHEDKIRRIQKAKEEANKRINIFDAASEVKEEDNPPYITVCICTYGAHKTKTEEAIYSFLLQSYPYKKLLIYNTHKDPITFDKEYENIRVINDCGKNFDNLGEKHIYMISQVDTDYWCILDDDDIILPWHLENLAKATIYNRETYDKPSHKRPLMTICDRKIISFDNDLQYIKTGGGWTCRAFGTIGYDELKAKLTKPYKIAKGNYDSRICTGKWHEYTYPHYFLPSYVWRGGGSYHLSAYGSSLEITTNQYNDRESWANTIDNSEVWIPHFEKDYIADFYNWYLSSNTENFKKYGENYHYTLKLNGEGSMRQAELDFVIDFIKDNDIKSFVEIGSGASTVYFSKLEDISFTSYETDPYWRTKVSVTAGNCIRLWDGEDLDLNNDNPDLIFIDGPDPCELREASFKAAISSNTKYIAMHDTFREVEQGFINKYLIGNGWELVDEFNHNMDKALPKKERMRGVQVYKNSQK